MDNLVHKTKPNKYKLIKYLFLFFGAKRKKNTLPKHFRLDIFGLTLRSITKSDKGKEGVMLYCLLIAYDKCVLSSSFFSTFACCTIIHF